MVFFTCNSCGESLKKNKVDKHLNLCHSKSVSCVDCGKDFTYDYQSHNTCISEDQKYGGLDYKPKDNSNKGQSKQEEWVQKIRSAINESDCSKQIKELLQRLSGYDNIPRKRPKFINFVRSCLRVTNDYYVEQMWNFFETVIKSETNKSNVNGDQSQQNGNKRTKIDSDVNETQNKRQKTIEDKTESTDENTVTNGINGDNSESVVVTQNEFEDNNEAEESKPKLKINKIIVKILKESESNQMKVKKLKKKVIKTCKSIDENLTKEDIETKFNNKLNKIKKIEINGEIVSLKQK